jgi:F0F1-type ATP synthase alpha subunit
MYCIYVAILVKNDLQIIQIVEALRKAQALEYTVVVAATAIGSSTFTIFSCFYSGAAIGEIF